MAILATVFVLYFLFLIALLVGWKMAARPVSAQAGGRDPLISVIVPVRNEQAAIGELLRSLDAQDCRNFEVIVVDDGSDDGTVSVVNQSGVSNLRVIENPGTGKKAAITAGVRAARGSLIVTTDGDCVVPPGWLREIRTAFRDHGVEMVFGGVRIAADRTFFTALQAMEFASLVGTGASTSALGVPTMCNGANLAFRKKAFTEVKGYADNLAIPSGDDEFLMRKIHARHPGGIRFLYTPVAVVTTAPQPGVAAFVNQRLRWASKWKYNTSLAARATAVLVVVFQLAFVVNGFLLLTPSIRAAIFLAVVKMILEAAFLLQVCRFLAVRWKWTAFFTLQVVYPPYVIGVAVAAFFRPFEWKRRIFRPS